MSTSMPTALAVVIAVFILLPFSVLTLYLFSTALERSVEDWPKLQDVTDKFGWTALLIVKVGAALLFLYLVYWVLRVIF